jgi:hypothetical protein
MYNFISTFDELNKLYEEADAKKVKPGVKVQEAYTDTLVEAADEDILEDEVVEDEAPVEEAPVEEPVVEDEPRQLICECDKCGALVIKDEKDIVVDEETGLVNVEDECQFCEEANGFKIVGVVAPYETVTVEEEPVEEEPVEEEPVEEEDFVEESLELDEGVEHWYHTKFDKPYSIKAQQQLEAELNGECGEISDARRKEIEEIFAWQRDWEERHPDVEVK